jgi:CheY-like chemotaxis protein
MTLIAITGYGQDADRERALAAGFDAHLVKPFGYAQLMEVLQGLERDNARNVGGHPTAPVS